MPLLLDTLVDFLLGHLPSVILVGVWWALLRASRFSGWRMALVLLPGTWLHEVSHWLVGLLLGARPTSFTLWPKREGNTWVLGSVGFTRLTIYNGAFVALAPLLLFALGAAAFQHLLGPAFEAGQYGWWLALGYPTAAALYSGLPSTTDIRVGALSIALYAGTAALLWQLSS